jgi:hypothetical protein
LDRNRDDGTGLRIHRMLGLVGQVRPAILHLRNLRVRIVRMRPIPRTTIGSVSILPSIRCGRRSDRLYRLIEDNVRRCMITGCAHTVLAIAMTAGTVPRWAHSSFVPVAVVLSVSCAACMHCCGLNSTCVWPEERGVSLDLAQRRDQQHLLNDVRLAEELGVRYADRNRIMRGNPQRWQPIRRACDARLFEAIAATHGIAVSAVLKARKQLDQPRFELVLFWPMGLIYLVCTWTGVEWLRRRFADDERRAAIAACAIASVMTCCTSLTLGEVSGEVIQMIRVGNTHLSYRALRVDWAHQHRAALLIAGIVVFWVVAMFRTNLRSRRISTVVDATEPNRTR